MAIRSPSSTLSPSSSPRPIKASVVARKNVDDGHCLDVPLLQQIHAVASENKNKDHYNENGTSLTRTCMNGLNALSGVGILSVPYALSEGGWLSLSFLLLVAIICCYTGLLLQRCMSANSSIRTYPDIGEHAFGFMGRMVVSIFLYLELYLIAIEFLILEGDNLDKLWPDRVFDLGFVALQGKEFFTIVAALIILPTTWLKNLSSLALISIGGIIASSAAVVSVLWVGIFDHVGFHERGSLFNLRGLPSSVSLYTFCYCGHAVFPMLLSSMKEEEKWQFSKVLYFCFIFCTLNYGSMAIIGYLMYGESIQSQVTLNLPKEKIASYAAIGMTLMSPFTKYALVVSPVATAIEERFLLNHNTFATIVTRTLIVISTVLIAVYVPFFGYVTAFIGSSASVVVSILLPCLCYLKIFEPTQESRSEIVTITFILILGIFICIVGTYTSVRQIIGNL